jgi:hypothetical protein
MITVDMSLTVCICVKNSSDAVTENSGDNVQSPVGSVSGTGPTDRQGFFMYATPGRTAEGDSG